MINHINLRDQGQGPRLQSQLEVTPSQALSSLVVYELDYGGRVVKLSDTEVTVESRLLLGHTVDTTIFRGREEEMQFLTKVAACHSLILGNQVAREALCDQALNFLGRLPQQIGGSPMYVTLLTPFILGGSSAKAALVFAAGITDQEGVKQLMHVPLQDLVDAVELYRETGQPLLEIVEEYGLMPA